MKQVKKYSKNNKIKAVELSIHKGNISMVADELGISAKNISRWKQEYEAGKYADDYISTNIKTQEQLENIALRKALKDAELERDILKKELGIFYKSGR